ncbi:uncharacterized protein HMPREF1541_06319 [Cyphellophora europaea CBS 101466]|uniref:NADH dehydrogenase [ubiquinone] 1 beta subcomplex subunit 11, mitochondrial n=1 Tax=Cyphellophora europaea (strain CBS 101466) TaxID=1220924 RepID=W2RRD8_CYPE1|nr:uncharacterized protein HMPREF1541_06319 [Cyphellophora europaea CBS 101466]ETN38288.1 hypothetical protein HMPREF1541_06319 [Cyphellophora europaea CBS 101466]
MLPRALPRTVRAASSRSPSSIVARAAGTPIRGATATSRALSTSNAQRAAASHDDHGHESHYDPPGGWLWGVPPGEKREREGWEIPFFTMYCGSLVIAVVAYTMKEDTSIQTWALEEARRRLEKEGILEDPQK